MAKLAPEGYEYIIVGDTEKYKDCLVYTVGKDRDHAEKVLQRMFTNPGPDDLEVLKDHTNLRIKEVKSSECWWNDPFLAN